MFLSLSLSQANSWECRSPLSSLSCPGLQDPRERVPCAYVKQWKPHVKGFIGFLHKPRNVSLFLSLFLIIDSGPPDSSTLKDLNKSTEFHGTCHHTPYFSTVQTCFKYYVMETTEYSEAKTLGFELGELGSSPYISVTLEKSFFHSGSMFMNFFIQLYIRTPIFYISDENIYFHWMLIEGRP